MQLACVPKRLFTNRLATGEHELFCYLRIVENAPAQAENDAGDEADRLVWQITDRDSGQSLLSGVLFLTEQARTAGRLALAAVLPPTWAGGQLHLEIPQKGWRSVQEVERLTQQNSYRLPLAGFVIVLGGHRTGEVHRAAWQIPAQHFAWDMLALTPALGLLRTEYSEALQNEHFARFGAPVLAPAAGVVVRAVDEQPDLPYTGAYPDPKQYLAELERALGNYVVLEHEPGVYSILGHLRQGSVKVGVGAKLETGQPLGELGNSGFSSGPHLHFHFMDGPDLLTASPLPIELEVEGRRYAPQSGEIISG